MQRAILWTCAIVLALNSRVIAQPDPDLTDLDLDGVPGEAGPPEFVNPEIPSVLVATGSVLVDHSHDNDFDVSGFTDSLASQGWTIDEHSSGPITDTVLDGYDILVIPTRSDAGPTTPFTASEISSVQAFLSAGNGLWMLNDNQDPSGMNTLSGQFGVEFQYDYIRDPSNNEGRLFWPTIYLLTPHAITTSVESYGYFLGDCLIVNAPSSVIARADDDAYSPFCPAGSFPAVLAVWDDIGRAVFSGDGTPLHPNYYPERLREEEQLLLQNIANWLLGDQPTLTAPFSWGRLKSIFRAVEEGQ